MYDYMNNGFNGGQFYYGGQQPQAMQKFNNALTAEEIDRLTKTANNFNLTLTQEEMLRASCNHRNKEGTGDTLVVDPATGKVRCSICGYEFKPVDSNISSDDIKEYVEEIINILQTIKMMYIDLPQDAIRQFFPIIPMLEKIPQLFEFAAKNMQKHDTFAWNYQNSSPAAFQMFTNLQNAFGNGMGFNPQPMPGMGQPMGAPAPMNAMAGFPNAAYGAPAQNPFGYPGAAQMQNPAYQPQMNNYAYQPQVPTTPAPTTTPQPVVAEPDKKGTADVVVTQDVKA